MLDINFKFDNNVIVSSPIAVGSATCMWCTVCGKTNLLDKKM